LRNEWISLQQQHAALEALCEFEKEPPENPVKSTPESFGVGVLKLHTFIYDALAHLRSLHQTKRAKALPINDHRLDAYWARSKDHFGTSTLQGTPDKDIGLTNAEFHEWIAATFSLPSPICKQHFCASAHKSNKGNHIKTVDLYGDNVKTAAGVPGGSFMHVHQALVNVVGNDLRRAKIMFKRGIEAFSGAVSGYMESKKRLTQHIIPDMIIKAKDGVTNNIMLDFKSICSTSSVYQHAEGKYGVGAGV
jgi:hypothetical protein